MTRRKLTVLFVAYILFMTTLYWVAIKQPVGAVDVSVEVVAPEPVMIETVAPDVVDSYEQGIPETWNPQK